MDLEAVSIKATKEEVAQAFTQSHFSRLLVYEENIDKIVGVIHQKDFYVGSGITSKSIPEIMTEPIFVLSTEKINDLLKLLQSHKSHIAVVIDEYGGTQGIVTMEDILEELVGEIWDEHDTVEEPIRKLDAHAFVIDGDVTFDDFTRTSTSRRTKRTAFPSAVGSWKRWARSQNRARALRMAILPSTSNRSATTGFTRCASRSPLP